MGGVHSVEGAVHEVRESSGGQCFSITACRLIHLCLFGCRCTDPGLEDFGNKWSFSALLRHLQKEGVDTTCK